LPELPKLVIAKIESQRQFSEGRKRLTNLEILAITTILAITNLKKWQ
jgi:hypothetical protein